MNKMLASELELLNQEEEITSTMIEFLLDLWGHRENQHSETSKLLPKVIYLLQEEYSMHLVHVNIYNNDNTSDYVFKQGNILVLLTVSKTANGVDVRFSLHPMYANTGYYHTSLNIVAPFEYKTLSDLDGVEYLKHYPRDNFDILLKNAGWLFNRQMDCYERPLFMSL